MLFIFNVIAPVFCLVGLGYFATWFKAFPQDGIKGLIAFTNNFAAPFLLFRAMLTIDFSSALNPNLIFPFYIAALSGFIVGIILARVQFGARPGESVAVGFAALFTNTVLLGIPIIQRAYGDEALPTIYMIIGFHAPTLMSVGMLTMEMSRRDGRPIGAALREAGKRIATNPLLIGIASGVALNLSGLQLPLFLDDTTKLLVSAVLPTALFGLGAALTQYRLSASWAPALAMAIIKNVMHPTLAYLMLVPLLGVPMDVARIVVLLAAMPTGINAYIFSTYFNRGTDVAATTVLIGTLLSVFTISFWLWVLS
jgi:predicted permease